MSEQSLLDKHCADAHASALTAGTTDPQSGACVTADEWGTIAITKPGDHYPSIIFNMGEAVRGAVAITPGGGLVGVGDDEGTVAVYKTWDGSCIFEDIREGEAGEERAMRALTFNPEGTNIASLSVDGVIRVFDIQRWERIANYQGFSGNSLHFDAQGNRILAIDSLGQPKLVDLLSHEIIDLEMVPGGVQEAHFASDSRLIVTLGQSGVTLIELPDARIVNSFSAKGSSGMNSLIIHPDGTQIAAITERSVHRFQLPTLEHLGSEKHGAPEPTKVALWDWRGISVGNGDGRFYRPGAAPSLPPIICCSGYGDQRVAAHGDWVAIWQKTRQRRPFRTKSHFVEVHTDRDGYLMAGFPDDDSGVQVYDARKGRHLFSAGRDTSDTTKLNLGGSIVACMLKQGGIRWYELKKNNVFELPWVQSFALSGSGTWIAAVTPQGFVRILDPETGEDALPEIEPVTEDPIIMTSFVSRRPEVLTLDSKGLLCIYDLTQSVEKQAPAIGRDILDFNVPINYIWGISGGEYAALRFQEANEETASILYVDLRTKEVVSEVTDLLPFAWVDSDSGRILQPARGGAILELDMYGKEYRVLRALPEGQWVTIDEKGIIDSSDNIR